MKESLPLLCWTLSIFGLAIATPICIWISVVGIHLCVGKKINCYLPQYRGLCSYEYIFMSFVRDSRITSCCLSVPNGVLGLAVLSFASVLQKMQKTM